LKSGSFFIIQKWKW